MLRKSDVRAMGDKKASYRMWFPKPVKRALSLLEAHVFSSLIRQCLVGWGSAEVYECRSSRAAEHMPFYFAKDC